MSSIFRYRELIRNLVFKDLKLKYRDSTFGFLWSLANPLLVITVYSFVFGHLLRVGVERFPYFLMIGILAWNFFAQSLMMSTGSILENGNLIRKVAGCHRNGVLQRCASLHGDSVNAAFLAYPDHL